jgi:4-amino-4-deoxy-L-arabinose transferase-like glycosyltransferase
MFVLDAEEYHTYATNILNGTRLEVFPDGRPLHPLRPPMYPIFIAAIYFIFGSHKIPVYLAQIFLNGLISLLIYSLSLKIFDNRNSAFFASILFALHLPTLVHAAIYYPEILFSFCLIITVSYTYRAFNKPTITRFLILGFIIGVTALVKPVVQFLPIIIFPVLYSYLNTKKWRAIYLTAALITTFIITMTPWIIRNYIVYNTFIFCDTTGGLNLYTSNYILEMPDGYPEKVGPMLPMTDEIKKMAFDKSIEWPQKDKIYYREAMKMIKKHPWKMVKVTLVRVVNYFTGLKQRNILYNIGYPSGMVISQRVNNLIVFSSAFINIIYLTLALIAVIIYSNKVFLKESLFLIVLILYFTSIHSISNAFERYSVAIFPYVIIFAGHGLSQIISKKLKYKMPSNFR